MNGDTATTTHALPDKPPAMYYRMSDTGPDLLRTVLEKKGWLPYIEGESSYWNLWWKGSRYRTVDYEACLPFQRLNHFPKTAVITRKDSLFRMLKTMRGIYGAVFDFFPHTFSLPNDYIRFVRLYAEEEEKGEKSTWICKPADLSRGRKIFVFRNLQHLQYDCNAILQRYIPNPMLISGYKFDLRCYVCVRSFNPLNIYLYNEGLTRFATAPYDMQNLTNQFSHLTNTSINKLSPTLNDSKEGVGAGCKWTLGKLREYFKTEQLPFDKLWDRMKAIMILTLLPVASEVKEPLEGCFELYGFDIIVDESLRPWLLEVNLSPALTVDSDVDVQVKTPLLDDVVRLSGISEADADEAVKYTTQQTRMKAEPRLFRKKSPMSLSGTPTLPKKTRPTYPDSVGSFVKIFPFNEATKAESVQIGKSQLKNTIQEVKRHFFQ
ncbi:putative tubulin polyglutamylase ttll2 [Chytriomyces hyalinus]|nr:putative tubulin polyglutamylase ttll2 [Chytriomyces hyalinus]